MAFQMGFQLLHLSFKTNRKETKGTINPSWEFKDNRKENKQVLRKSANFRE